MRTWMMLAAISGFLGVAFGAFGAHGVADPAAREWLRTGAQYQFVHALATIGAAVFVAQGARLARLAPWFFLGGTMLFSGSLYAMALGGPRGLGAVTPLGGLAFMIGWLILAWSARKIERT